MPSASRINIFLFLTVAQLGFAFPLWAEHRPLLPRPQEVKYGAGHLPVCSISIEGPADSTEDDQFSVQQLQALIEKTCGSSSRVVGAANDTTPLVLKRTSDARPLATPGEVPGPDSRESYEIQITSSGANLTAPSTAGLFYAVQTIRQLVEGEGRAAFLPEVEIHDWPSLAYRGTMLDVSHGPLPTEAELERQLDFLALWKTNQYYLYSEASIEMDDYPLLNPNGRFTRDEVRRIIAYGRQRHIDVIPFVELYGHIHDLLRIEHYSHLGAFPHGPELDPLNPEIKGILTDWAGQIAELFPSPFVHIGFDETWQLEMEARKAGVSAGELFSKHLSYVAGLFQSRGKTVMAWADIVVQYPGVTGNLPKGLIPVAWDYSAEPDIKKWIDPLVKQNLPYFVTTGVANWNEIAVDFDLTFSNIDNFLLAARKSKALGLINSVWLDSSYGLTRVALPAIAYGAVAPWQSSAVDRPSFFNDYAALLYGGEAASHMATALRALNSSEVTIQKVLGEQCFYELWESPFDPDRLQRSAQHEGELRQARLSAEDAQTDIYLALKVGLSREAVESNLFAAEILDYAAYRYLNALEISNRWKELAKDFHRERFWEQFDSEVTYQSHSRLVDMMDRITELRDSYRQLWLREYTPYRLATTLGRFDAEYEYWRDLQSKFRNVSRSLQNGAELPPLETVVH